MVRDLINLPPNFLGPAALAAEVRRLAASWNASFREIVGDDLLAADYRAIHAVGRASTDLPRLLDVRWGDPEAPLVTLVGKGVCFDSGGLNIKSRSSMQRMKYDMAGGAHVLGLADLIVRARLNVRLRVLIPAVENSIAGNAMRPSDVVRIGRHEIEVNDTDSEGRLILADAFRAAASDTPGRQPNLLIDVATLTGAAERALGPDLPAVFSNDSALLEQLYQAAVATGDPVWPMPLWRPYRSRLASDVATMTNAPADDSVDAICAALFLQEFLPPDTKWLHVDMTPWNEKARPGRPIGGEARALFAIECLLERLYGRSPEKKNAEEA